MSIARNKFSGYNIDGRRTLELGGAAAAVGIVSGVSSLFGGDSGGGELIGHEFHGALGAAPGVPERDRSCGDSGEGHHRFSISVVCARPRTHRQISTLTASSIGGSANRWGCVVAEVRA